MALVQRAGKGGHDPSHLPAGCRSPAPAPHRGARVCVQRLVHLSCASEGAKGKGPVSVCISANTSLPLCNPPPPQGLVPSACCQVLSVFFPEASDCFLKKPDPRAQTKAGAAKGETPFSPPLSLTPPPSQPPSLWMLGMGSRTRLPSPRQQGALVAMVINVGEAGQPGQKPPHSPHPSPQSPWDGTETHSINFISERPLGGEGSCFCDRLPSLPLSSLASF